VFVGLAYLDGAPHPEPPSFAARLASSPTSAELLAAHLRCRRDEIVVTGSPRLDELPDHLPEPGRRLVLSTVSDESPDRGAALADAAAAAAAAGWEVTMRLHPREPEQRWNGFGLDRSPSVTLGAQRAAVALGYPGTVFVELAAMGVPLLGLATEPWMLERVPAEVADLCTPVHATSDIADLLAAPRPAPSAAAAGPLSGAAARIWGAARAAAHPAKVHAADV
jgi:hypothetical protein